MYIYIHTYLCIRTCKYIYTYIRTHISQLGTHGGAGAYKMTIIATVFVVFLALDVLFMENSWYLFDLFQQSTAYYFQKVFLILFLFLYTYMLVHMYTFQQSRALHFQKVLFFIVCFPSLYICICICIYTYVQIYVHVYIYIHICKYLYISVATKCSILYPKY